MNTKKVISDFLFALLASSIISSVSAWFLISLNVVTQIREYNNYIIFGLPIAGLFIGLLYHYYGASSVKGSNLVLETYKIPDIKIPFLMTPFIFLTSIVTHLFGGSAGREGTAVQMGASISDTLQSLFHKLSVKKNLIIIIGISAGFSSVFGTPLTAAVFALEVLAFKQFSFYKFIVSLFSAYVAYFICELWQPGHTHYHIAELPNFNLNTISYVLLVGLLFGLCAFIFSSVLNLISKLFGFISYSPFRPFVGGILLVIIFYSFNVQAYQGLGIPMIQNAFSATIDSNSFAIKIFLTALTLGSGFKGGEVTPLFFIGATLGNTLSLFIPLPMAFLAGLGFVSVFAGATNTPLACAIMGMELFGWQFGIYMFLSCFIAYLFSGKQGIYSSQEISFLKRKLYSIKN